jgi:hypothetical protein
MIKKGEQRGEGEEEEKGRKKKREKRKKGLRQSHLLPVQCCVSHLSNQIDALITHSKPILLNHLLLTSDHA